MKKVAILQSNYIPWKGYFDLIAAVDEFIIYDDVQFTKNDWRNRNQIKTPQGVQWLTIPVGQNIRRRIIDVEWQNTEWQIKHWKTLTSNYCKAKYFSEIAAIVEPIYTQCEYTHLSLFNQKLIETICSYLNIETKISHSKDFQLPIGTNERLVDLCLQVGAGEYISGPSAKNYLEESLFTEKNIKITWFDYSGYREYPQLWGTFTHHVSILDLLFNCGHGAPHYMRYV